jgi:hypothetical protein
MAGAAHIRLKHLFERIVPNKPVGWRKSTAVFIEKCNRLFNQFLHMICFTA